MKRINRKGFTLIELLGVVFVLSMIFILILPNVLNAFKEAEVEIDEATKEIIVDATEDYLIESKKLENNYYCIKILDLVESGLIDNKVLQNLESNNYYVRVNKKGNKKDFKIVDKCNPVIDDLNLTSNSNTITVEVIKNLDGNETVKYYYSLDNKNFNESNNNIYVFSNLRENTEYNVYVKIKNENNVESEVYTKTIRTKALNNPEIKLVNTPKIGYNGYLKKQEAIINFKTDDLSEPLYYVKTSKVGETNVDVLASCGKDLTPTECMHVSDTKVLESDTWYQVKGDISVTYENTIATNENIYAMVYDKDSYVGSSTSTLSKIDDDVPTIALKAPFIKTNSIILTYDIKDIHSGIDSYTCKYGIIDDNYTSIGDASETSCALTSLEDDKTYYYQICAKDKVGNKEVCQTGSAITTEIHNPVIIEASKTPASGYDYATERIIKITYNDENITSPEYYFKSTVSATVSSGIITHACGTGIDPGICTSSTVTTLSANTWYKTANKTPSIIYKVNGDLYAVTSDGTNFSGTSTYTISKVDTTGSSAEITVSDVRTDRATVIASCIDNESGIIKYEFSKDNGINWVESKTSNKYTFKGLIKETGYTYKIRCTNGSGLEGVASTSETTLGFNNPTIKQISKTPESGYDYATERIVKITYNGENIENPVYYFKSSVTATVPSGVVTGVCGTDTNPGDCSSSSVTTLDANTWYKTTSTTPNITYKENGTLYAVTSDGKNLSGIATYTVSKIDTTASSASLTIGTIKTDRVTITASCADSESRITKYEFSKDNGSTWISNGTTIKYTFTGLTKETSYTYKIRCTNGSGLTNIAGDTATTKGFTNPTIVQASKTPASGYDYATERVIKITYSSTNVQKPEYYFKSTVDATVESGVVTQACGTDTPPSTCTDSSVTTLVANTWYKTTSTTPSITYTANGDLYAVTSDGENLSGTATYTVSKMDTSIPSASISVGAIKTDRVTITASCADSESGITKYEFSQDDGTNWTSNGTTNSYIFTGLTKESSYTYKIRCTNGSGLTNTASNTASTLGMTNPTIEQASETVTSGYTWATERVIKITYSGTNIESPVYYFKSTVAGTVASGVVTHACGTGTNPGTCSSSSVTTLVADTWYKTTSEEPSITYKANGTLYAVTSDGKNLSGTATYTISKTSSGTPTTPTITGGSTSWSSSAKTISVSTASTETSGILKYQYYISTSSSSRTGGSWKDCVTSLTSQSISTNGTRYIYFRAIANNGKISSASSYQTTMIDTEIPSAPVLTGGSSNWSSSAKTISVSTASTATSGIDYYQYYISTSSSGQVDGEWIDLESGTTGVSISTNGTSYIYFRAVSTVGKVGTISEPQITMIDTGTPTAPTITGGLANWSSSAKTISVSAASTSTSGINYYQYYISTSSTGLSGGSWTSIATGTTSVSISTNGTRYIYFRAVNNAGTVGNISESQITMIDTGTPLAPVITGGSSSWSSSAKTISVSTASTATSEINYYQYYISTSSSGQSGGSWTSLASGTTSVSISTNGTSYIYFRAVSNAGKTGAISSYQTTMIDTGTPTAPTLTGGSTSWSSSAKTISVSTASTATSGISYYQYYISTSNSSQAGGSWTNLASGKTSVSVSTNGTRYVYFRAVSGVGTVGSVSTAQTTKVDTANPSVTVSVSGKTATLTLSDAIGIVGYGVNQSSSTQPSWTSASGTSASKTWTASSAGTYVAWVKDNAGRTATASFTIASTAFCAYSAGQTWNYSYNGGIQTFTTPCAGTYKLEVWGAQGGPAGGSPGGLGGYSKGNVSLSAGQALYVVVGGIGNSVYGENGGGVAGGYNGGGRAGSDGVNWTTTYFGSGGGATHIATRTGLLSALASYKSNILIVAGGGGGTTNSEGTPRAGGTGGGTNGGNGVGNGEVTGNYGGGGGTQSSGGLPNYAGNAQYGGFGYGGNGYEGNGCGGGGGYYGGGGTQSYSGGGGGSGYIGGVTGGSMSNGQRTGHGYATITLVTLNN